MSIWLEAAKQARCQTDRTDKTLSIHANPTTRADAPAEVPSVLSVRQFKRDSHSSPGASPRALTTSGQDDDDMFRHGRSIAGNPVTWTGRIIRLDEWRQLSAWDRHGPDGRLFCGICRAWVAADSFPHCHGENGGAA
ncbi:hypothetical protein [Haematobacter massiliensis]|uniref:hypothetical protein n=1 Tax=Haematobacter massiliensis TaxID=195105 RepID=UPI00103C9749|nr:hypothetical protein [Haematobacter massiliensis]QBJ24014.1 hypothetical protein HmaOT1_06935 [Haematobacter massiliensis]